VRPEDRLAMVPRVQKPAKARADGARMLFNECTGAAGSSPPAPERAEPVKLRCVGLRPQLLSLAELGDGDCRYPYGGDKDGDPITFCGHPRLRGSSYCAPHFHLARAPAPDVERPLGPFVLRLVEAA
jgi:GcrA cell cycle regulator